MVFLLKAKKKKKKKPLAMESTKSLLRVLKRKSAFFRINSLSSRSTNTSKSIMDVSHALSRKAKRAEEDCMRDAQLTRPILHLGAAALLVLQHPLFFSPLPSAICSPSPRFLFLFSSHSHGY